MNVWAKWGGLTALNLVLMVFTTVLLAGWDGLRGALNGAKEGSSLLILVSVIVIIVVGILWLQKKGADYHTVLVVAIGTVAAIALGGLAVTLLTTASFGFYKPIVLLAAAIAAAFGTLVFLNDR